VESDRKFIQFLDVDDFLNIDLLVHFFISHRIPQDALSIFEYIGLTEQKFPKYLGVFESKVLSKSEIEEELFERKGYWRVIYPREIIIENNLKFSPTFEDLGGKRFILDDLFWVVHLISIGLKCIKYDEDAIVYGYVKNEVESTNHGDDFAMQASLFPLATIKFLTSLDGCKHSHNQDFLEKSLTSALLFHARYIRMSDLLFYVLINGRKLQQFGNRKFRPSRVILRLRLSSIAVIYSVKHSIRRFAYRHQIGIAIWNYLKFK